MSSKVFSDRQSAKLLICNPRSRMQEDGHSVGQVSETGKALTKWHKIIRAREDLDFLSFLKAKTSSNSFPCLSANGLVIPRIGKKVDGFRISSKISFFFIKYSSSHIDRQVGRVQQGWHGGHGTVINMVDSVKSSRGKSEKKQKYKIFTEWLEVLILLDYTSCNVSNPMILDASGASKV